MSTSALDLEGLASPRRVNRIMLEVMLALVPGTLTAAWLIDLRVVLNVAFAIALAIMLEAALTGLRRRPMLPTIGDGSIALAAWLLALTVPTAMPWWQLGIGVLAMVTVGKHLYGGLGSNPFNPAMVGYAVLIVSFPLTMTTWPASAGGVSTSARAPTVMESAASWDAITSATPLDRLRTRDREGISHFPPTDTPGVTTPTTHAASAHPDELIFASPWPLINTAFLAGGLWLLARRLISWRIPLSVLGMLALLHGVHALISSTVQASVAGSLLAGAAILGAFFIATDPVSAATGPRARLIYGSTIGALIFVFREFGAYPEGVAFAVLLANASVPLLERCCDLPSRP